MNENRQFAFGDDSMPNRDGTAFPCPAVAAGYSPNSGDGSIEPAEWYDEELREQTGYDEGVVDEQTAREAWLRVIDAFEKRANDRLVEPRNAERHRKNARVAREIADELGW